MYSTIYRPSRGSTPIRWPTSTRSRSRPRGNVPRRWISSITSAAVRRLGGRYGTKLHVNASLIYQPKDVYYVGKVPEDAKEMNFVYLDASFDFEKQWNKQFKTTFLFAFQRMMGEEWTMVPINRYVFALDGLYKFNTKHSLRLELQYLYSPFVTMETTGAEGPVQERLNDKRNNGDWWAAQTRIQFRAGLQCFRKRHVQFPVGKGTLL